MANYVIIGYAVIEFSQVNFKNILSFFFKNAPDETLFTLSA